MPADVSATILPHRAHSGSPFHVLLRRRTSQKGIIQLISCLHFDFFRRRDLLLVLIWGLLEADFMHAAHDQFPYFVIEVVAHLTHGTIHILKIDRVLEGAVLAIPLV